VCVCVHATHVYSYCTDGKLLVHAAFNMLHHLICKSL